MAASILRIGDIKLRSYIARLRDHIDAVNKGISAYNPRHFRKYRDKIINRFEDFIKGRRKEIRKIERYYDVRYHRVKKVFEYAERNIITTFERNATRAFGQAMHSIERALGEELSAPGVFGVYGLLKYLRKRPKLKESVKVEGLTRVTKKGTLFSISLIPYLVLLIRTAQIEWYRKVNEALSYEVGTDLVWIDSHPCWMGASADEVCNRWRDRIVSLSGLTPGFPRLKTALEERPPLFHPNCTHSMHALTQEQERIAINKGIKFYKSLKKYA